MNLNATDVIAYLGAAAWLPQIVILIYNLKAKPILTIIPDKNVQIGYTNYGAIFNLRLSINVHKKDTLINFIGVEIHHESGSKHYFEWTGMTEFFSEVKNSTGVSQIIERDIIPISIKLSTLSLVERFFRFQDSSYIQLNKTELDKLIEVVNLKRKNSTDFHDDFLDSEEVEGYIKFIRSHFYWKPGTYNISFLVRSPATYKIRQTIYKFTLTEANIDMLRRNLDEIKADIEYHLKINDIKDFDGKPGNWIWCNTILTEKKEGVKSKITTFSHTRR